MSEQSKYDALMHKLCVDYGWCGCMKDSRPLHVDHFVPRSGPVTAEQFAEWTILADGENPNVRQRQDGSWMRDVIAEVFREIMGADVVDASELHWTKVNGREENITKRTTYPSRIGSVTLVVPDYDGAIDFYVTCLGFHLVEDVWVDNQTKRWVRVAPPGAETALLLAKADGPEQVAAIGNQTGGRVGFFLETDDFAQDHTAMLAKGVTFKEEPRHEDYGTVAVFVDPFGNLWDLIQPKSKLTPKSRARDS